jgi:hypothetical protein
LKKQLFLFLSKSKNSSAPFFQIAAANYAFQSAKPAAGKPLPPNFPPPCPARLFAATPLAIKSCSRDFKLFYPAAGIGT